MINTVKIPLMTQYLLRKIIGKYQQRIQHHLPQLSAQANSNAIDIGQIIASLHEDHGQRDVCAKQLEVLANMYQIQAKQRLHEESEQLELKILYILGYEVNG